MNNDFAVFILSNGRPNKVKTIDALRNIGYNGSVFIVCDNEDVTLQQYKDKYGESIIVFNKKQYAEITDTMTNSGNVKSVVFARNAVQDIAKQMGLDCFAVADDDIDGIKIRKNCDGKLVARKIKKGNLLFKDLCKILKSSKCVYAVGIASDGSYIGGVDGRYQKGLDIGRANQFFIHQVSKQVEYKGISNEDEIAYSKYSELGKLFVEVMDISKSSPERGTNLGGLNEMYKSMNSYTINFYSIISRPDCIKLALKNDEYKLIKKWEYAVPKILNERYKR